MGVDWSATSVSTPYAMLLAQLITRDDDCATMFDGSTSTNLTTGTKRWSASNTRLEMWGGVSWSALVIGLTGGGTGASDAAGARSNLGLGTCAVEDTLPITKGGTGAVNAAAARSNLGLGTCAVENTLPVVKGGTGGTSQSTARAGLGIATTFDPVVTATTLALSRAALGVSSVMDGVIIAATLPAARAALGSTTVGDAVFVAANAAAAQSALGLGSLATKSSVATADITDAAVTPAKCAAQVIAFDMAFAAGMGFDFTGQNLAVQIYAEMVLSRNVTFLGEVGYLDTVSGGSAVIVDILKNGVTIYSAKPQFATGANALTGGTLSTTTASAGDRITFKVTQVGSSTTGQKLRFSLKSQVS